MQGIKTIVNAAAILFGITVSGCSGPKLNVNDLIGKWEIDNPPAAAAGAQCRVPSPNFHFEQEDKFTGNCLPGDLLYIAPGQQNQFVSGSGKWKLGTEQGR